MCCGVVLERPTRRRSPSISSWCGAPGEVGRKARVVGELGAAHGLAETAEERVLVRRDDHPGAVARPEDVRGRDAAGARSRSARARVPSRSYSGTALSSSAKHDSRSETSTTCPRPSSTWRARAERASTPCAANIAGQRVAERDAEPRRRLVREAVDVAQAAHGLRDRRQSRPAARRARSGRSPRRARGSRPGVDLREPLVAEVPLLERAGPEVLDHDVAACARARAAAPAALAPRSSVTHFLLRDWHGPPERAALVAALAPVAQRIGLSRALDLDHLGAHVGEQPAGERPGDQRAELEHAHAGERPDPAAGLRHTLTRQDSRRPQLCPHFACAVRSAAAIHTSQSRIVGLGAEVRACLRISGCPTDPLRRRHAPRSARVRRCHEAADASASGSPNVAPGTDSGVSGSAHVRRAIPAGSPHLMGRAAVSLRRHRPRP